MSNRESVGDAGWSETGRVAVCVDERRRHPRIRASFQARLGLRSEHITAALDAVDVSEVGVLLVTGEPVGARPGDRVCLTLLTGEGNLHRLGRVVRVARGDDLRTYVAVEYLDLFDPELAMLIASLRRAADPPEAPGSTADEETRGMRLPRDASMGA